MFDQLIQQLHQDGLALCPQFVEQSLVMQLRSELLQHWHEAQFHRAGVGHGQNYELNGEIRNDYILWLEPEQNKPVPTVRYYLELLEQLRLCLNRELMLGLFDFEGMMAVYPTGHFYKRHYDQFQDNGLRVLTTILYLNEDWQESDGGQLRVYLNPQQDAVYSDIHPEGGTLVCFLSGQYPHEVLPAHRQRLSLTGWFRRRADEPLV